MITLSRRSFLVSATALISTAASASTLRSPIGSLAAPAGAAPAAPPPMPAAPGGVQPQLFQAAMAALDRHGAQLLRDRIAIADFSAPSSQPRFHLLNLHDGTATTLLVAHGSGSDPAHSGWLQRFSNSPGSNASSEGAYATANCYEGVHGHSQRLIGLDPTNDNALDRAIVIHSAWYAEPALIAQHGKLGRSQGCFALPQESLEQVIAHLGEGRLIYAGKVNGDA